MAYKKAEEQPKEIVDFLKTDRKHVSFSPEYKQNHFFLIVSKSAMRVDANSLIKEQADVASEILKAPNTRCTIYVTKEFDFEQLKSRFFSLKPELKEMHDNGRIEFRLTKGPIEIWAQDVGQSVRTRNGKSELIKGISWSGFQTPPMPVPIIEIPILFEGGDVASTIVNGKKTIVIGPQSINNTRVHYERAGYDISDEEIKLVLMHAFGADNIILLSAAKTYDRPPYIFHIDQAVFFPKENVAVIINPDSINDERIKKGLVSYVDQLEKEGFEIIKIPSNDEQVIKYQAYANAIPIALLGGKTNVVLPSFDNELLEREIRKILENNGMVVTFVKDVSYKSQGNIHCITGAIARMYNKGLTPTRIG